MAELTLIPDQGNSTLIQFTLSPRDFQNIRKGHFGATSVFYSAGFGQTNIFIKTISTVLKKTHDALFSYTKSEKPYEIVMRRKSRGYFGAQF